MNNINNSKTDKNENSVLLKKSSLSYYKKNETNLFSSVPVDLHARAHPAPQGVVVGAKPLGLVVKQQSESSDYNPSESSDNAPYGYRKRYLVKLKGKNGKEIIVDSFKARQQRMTNAIYSFTDYIKPISESEGWQMKMVTLTYRKASDWKPKHMTKFTTWLKRVLGADLIAYAWVAELQKRGAIHYHLMVYTKKGAYIPYPDKPLGRQNFRGWKYGQTNVENGRLGQYLASYVSKEHQKDYYKFPKGARGFGIWVGSSVELKRLLGAYMNDKKKPLWVSADFPNIDFLDSQTSFKRIGGKWRIGDKVLDKLNAPKNFSFEGSKIRVKVPINKRIRHKKTDTFDFDSIKLKTLREVMPQYLESLNIWYEKGGWVLNDELLESSVSYESCEKIDASTWVSELMEKKTKKINYENSEISDYEKTANMSKINQTIIKAKWESHKTGKEIKPIVRMEWFRGMM